MYTELSEEIPRKKIAIAFDIANEYEIYLFCGSC